MSGASPRKFAEKIAIMNRKQNEDVNTFDSIMREVRQITSTETQAIPSPSTSLHPPQWNQLGGSLPNVHQMPSYQDWTSGWAEIPSSHGSRSPEQHPMHYHPYGRGPRSPDRVPPLHPHYVPYPNPQHQLLAAPEWNQINRARSDPQINQISMPMHMVQGNGGPIMVPHHMMQAGPSGMNMMPLGQQCSMPNAPNMIPPQPGMVPQSQSIGGPPQTPMQNMNMQSPLQSPMHYQMQSYGFPNGSPMQSPMGSPMGSSLMLDERTTPMMELSPPGMHDPCSEAGSLPNIHGMPQQPPPFYHQTVGQRHSTGGALVGATRLAPTTVRTPESQSAPTSPANNLDPSQHLQWPGTRTFSNSPESLDIPRLVLTNPEGTNGPHLECFNDLEHLTLDTNDMQMLCNGSGNGNPVQQDSRYSSE